MTKIKEIIEGIHPNSDNRLNNWTIGDIEHCMKEYAEWYATQCLKEADGLFDWDRDTEEWTGDYKPSEMELLEHE